MVARVQSAQSQSPEQHLSAVLRAAAVLEAREHLLPFIRLHMPDPNDPDNPRKSRYHDAPHHRMLMEAIERVERKEIMRFANSIPPQHGKSLILSKMAVAWIVGRHPEWHIIVATYGADFAQEIGQEVRDIMRSSHFKQVFPHCVLKHDSQSKTELKTTSGGSLTFIGRGEGATGRPCDLFIIDDPLKDDKEASSPTIRRELHTWYAGVVFSRCHVGTPLIIVHTRWHEDDLIGRQCDPEHPEYSEKRSKRWIYVNIPAEVKDPVLAAALGVEVGSALWAERFPLTHLAEARENDPRIYSALYMGRPTPEEGDYFKAEHIVTYQNLSDLPRRLRKYGASDHALTAKEQNDPNCMGVVGVDTEGDLWILPDLYWKHCETDVMVEEMLTLMRNHEPDIWWAAKDHIHGAIGPFLEVRMREEHIYTYIEPVPERKEITTRARSIQGRMQRKRIHFPSFASWWPEARAELLKFPNSTHDDFVAFLALIGMGMAKEWAARKSSPESNVIKVGSLAWVKAESNRDKIRTKLEKSHASR